MITFPFEKIKSMRWGCRANNMLRLGKAAALSICSPREFHPFVFFLRFDILKQSSIFSPVKGSGNLLHFCRTSSEISTYFDLKKNNIEEGSEIHLQFNMILQIHFV